MDSDDPLVQALPPATDYLTYLTLLEYQLTPERLPLLHRLLQDEKLTTNIGWDLVTILLPMLPASTECLQDVSRLGNPREVILRVCEALEHLQPEEGDEYGDDDEEDDEEEDETGKALPKHILQFNCLLAMLSTLHTRLQARRPSRFVATSLKAALEAYETMTCDETTLALLEFLRDLSPNKRPAPPPRAPSESSVLRVSQASAPDPEAEVESPSPAKDNETQLVRKFVQFGLLEMLKSYLLNFSHPLDPGMSWTVRMQEKLHPNLRLLAQSQTEAYGSIKKLRERDMIMGKIVALSRDVGIDSNDLLSIISRPAAGLPPLLDFDVPPETADQIPLERHGSLLLLAARAAGAVLFASSAHPTPPLPVFPDLAGIFSNFLPSGECPGAHVDGVPRALVDSLLVLTVHATRSSVAPPSSDAEFMNLVLAVTACTAQQSHAIIRQIPAIIVHSNPSAVVRLTVIRQILENSRLWYIRDSAISWVKNEVIGSQPSESPEDIFHDPLWIWSIFPLLLPPVVLDASPKSLDASLSRLTQDAGQYLHSALNLYFLLLASDDLRNRLQLEKTVKYFRSKVAVPLRKLFRALEADLTANGGDGWIEATIGEEKCQAMMAQSVGLLGLTLDQIEDMINEHFGTDDADLKEYSKEEKSLVAEILKKTEGQGLAYLDLLKQNELAQGITTGDVDLLFPRK